MNRQEIYVCMADQKDAGQAALTRRLGERGEVVTVVQGGRYNAARHRTLEKHEVCSKSDQKIFKTPFLGRGTRLSCGWQLRERSS